MFTKPMMPSQVCCMIAPVIRSTTPTTNAIPAATIRVRVARAKVVPTYEGRRAIDDVVTFVELTRYARARELSEDPRARIETDVETWREAVYRAVDHKRARRARWFPRSVTQVVTDLLPTRGPRPRR